MNVSLSHPCMTRAKKEPKTKAQREYEEEMKKDFDDMARDNILYKKYKSGKLSKEEYESLLLIESSLFGYIYCVFTCLSKYIHLKCLNNISVAIKLF